nr:DUF3168 domain-containing protein [Prosthecomicrobium hirschii]
MAVAIQSLLADPTMTGLVASRVYPLVAPQKADYPNVIVHMIFENEDMLLAGASEFAEARVSIECRAKDATTANTLAERVKDAFRGIQERTVSGCIASIRKEGTDVSDFTDDASVFRRILDFYVWWRKAA